MEMGMYAIFDSKTKVFGRPFVQHNHATAIRTFAALANDPNSDVCRFPTDTTLFYIGSYNDQNGVLAPTDTPNSLGLGSEYKEVH